MSLRDIEHAISSAQSNELIGWQTGKIFAYLTLHNWRINVMFGPGLHDIGSLFMPDRFHESDTENAPECGCVHKELYLIQEQERIGFIWSHVNKTPIQYESESVVIWYCVNGALGTVIRLVHHAQVS